MTTCCYVSAFYDIERQNWTTFSRTFSTYLERFTPFIHLFSKITEECNNMIVFIDEKHYHTLFDLIQKHNKENKNIHLIQINKQFLQQLSSWRKIQRENEIMNCENFKKLIYHRRHCPECYIPEYTMINHSKIDFINFVIDNNLSEKDVFSWVDFGFFSKDENIPERLLDLSLFDLSKITYSLINPIEEIDNDKIYTLIFAPEKIGGFFFIGNKNSMKEYQALYHNVIDLYHSIDICDDDQAIAIACYFKNKNLFSFTSNYGWHTIFKLHQK
jgi:hypothetical protein